MQSAAFSMRHGPLVTGEMTRTVTRSASQTRNQGVVRNPEPQRPKRSATHGWPVMVVEIPLHHSIFNVQGLGLKVVSPISTASIRALHLVHVRAWISNYGGFCRRCQNPLYAEILACNAKHAMWARRVIQTVCIKFNQLRRLIMQRDLDVVKTLH